MAISDERGRIQVGLTVRHDATGIWISDTEGRTRASFVVGPGGPRVMLYDEDSEVLGTAP